MDREGGKVCKNLYLMLLKSELGVRLCGSNYFLFDRVIVGLHNNIPGEPIFPQRLENSVCSVKLQLVIRDIWDKLLEEHVNRRLDFLHRFREASDPKIVSARPILEVIDFKKGHIKLVLYVLDSGCILIDSGR